MNVLLVAGGSPEDWPAFSVDGFDYVVGIDRGNLFLLERNIIPDLTIGDFDSLTEEEQGFVFAQAKEILTSPAEKDETDTQLAVSKVFEKFPNAKIKLIGATGGRLDHLLSNLWLGLEPRFFPFLQQLVIQDKQNHFSYLPPGEHLIQQLPETKYLGIICLTAVDNLVINEAKYTLTQTNFATPISLGSNEFIGKPATVSFTSGIVAITQNKDA